MEKFVVVVVLFCFFVCVLFVFFFVFWVFFFFVCLFFVFFLVTVIFVCKSLPPKHSKAKVCTLL